MRYEKVRDGVEYCDDAWYDAVLSQEALLTAESFSRADAYRLGQICIRLGPEKYGREVSVEVVMDNFPVFSYFPEGTGLRNAWWLDCKFNTVRKTGTCSLRALIERSAMGKPYEPWCYDAASFLLCGGGFPIRNRSGEVLALAGVSGLDHENDHQLLADAMAELFEVQIPSIHG